LYHHYGFYHGENSEKVILGVGAGIADPCPSFKLPNPLREKKMPGHAGSYAPSGHPLCGLERGREGRDLRFLSFFSKKPIAKFSWIHC